MKTLYWLRHWPDTLGPVAEQPFAVQVQPLFSTEALPQALALPHPDPHAYWVATSAQAGPAMQTLWQQGHRPAAIWVVGAATGQALQALGLPAQHPPRVSGGYSLAQYIINQPPRPVIHFCGEDHREEMGQYLLRAAWQYIPQVVYRQIPEQVQLRNPDLFQAVAVFSPAAVAYLAGLALTQYTPDEQEQFFSLTPWLVPGATSHQAARMAGVAEIYTAAEPKAAEVLAIAQRLLIPQPLTR